jgi:hypothetical protein
MSDGFHAAKPAEPSAGAPVSQGAIPESDIGKPPPEPNSMHTMLTILEGYAAGFEHLASVGMANSGLASTAAAARAGIAQIRERLGRDS